MSVKLGMGPVSAAELAAMIGCTPVCYGCDTSILISGVSTDSRKTESGDLYVAIKGERFDGADFSASAVLAGAVCVLSDRLPAQAEDLGHPFVFLRCDDPQRALGDLAYAYRTKRPLRIVAVTGSVGKTTTKEMIASVLSRRFRVGKTEGNLNTDIGLSLTMLGFGPETEVGVLEMGMSNFGEIERLSMIARPDFGVITNIGTSHIEFLGSREGIAKAKSEITAGMKDDGVLVLCGDEPLLRQLAGKKNTVFVSVYTENGEYRADHIRYESGRTYFDLVCGERTLCDLMIPELGIHHVYAALFAAAIGHRFGISDDELREGLACFRNAAMRQSIYEISGVTVIDASYNASPESMRASLSVLCELAREKNARKFALLGDMRELGSETRTAHEKLGREVAKLGLDGLVTFGIAAVCTAESAKQNGMPSDRVISEINLSAPDSCAEKLLGLLRRGDVLLVKASRAVAAEKIIGYLKEHGDQIS